ncbi:MAG: signal peptidase I [Saprospiraceae bacterium]|nr:signal peptidase I [Saprospiraceae bacterium]
MFYLVGNNKDDKYLGPTLIAEREYKAKLEEAAKSGNNREFQKLQRQNPYVKSQLREWTEASVFAVFAAAFIRMFLIEAYVIPTSSMEGSLKVGDFLFVSKAHYGIRTPKTVVMLPLLHNRLPFFNSESYLESPNLPFYRLPALQNVERYDPVVFNFPDGDSVFIFPDRTFSIGDYRRGAIAGYNPMYQEAIKTGQVELVTRPIDKKDHYIKRCIGLPGDSLKIVNRQVFINGEAAKNPSQMQFLTVIKTANGTINDEKLDEIGVDVFEKINGNIFATTETQRAKIKEMMPDATIELIDYPHQPGALYPHDEANFPNWTNDNFGPIYIPKKGATVAISPQNISLFDRIIAVYEGNKLEKKDGKIFINGQEATSYTFKMNYYWMMGDNRHNSEDSRGWGFVPEDHIVGKPLFIWFSTKHGSISNGINWDRIFTGANKM